MKNLIFLALLPTFCVTAYAADDLNQRTHIQPSVQTKINQEIAKAYIRGQATQSQSDQAINNKNQLNNKIPTSKNNANSSNSTNGAQMTINNFENVRQAPKEVITAVRGDIINICFHCR